MPILDASEYKPNLPFRNAHINTLYPYLFRKKKTLPFVRERIMTPDQDFFDVDWWFQGSSEKLVILLHGLEGSTDSQYINGMAQIMHQNQYNIAAINFRSCSGEMNLQMDMYHSGFTKDLHHFLNTKTTQFERLYICGFSLGGNVTMKYISDQKQDISPKIKAAAGISVPCDLKGGSIKLKKWYNHLYEQRFLATLLQKVMMKHTMMPDKIDISNIHKIKTLWDFDEIYTAGFHGFVDAEDYYLQCSSVTHLQKIKIPTLMINALDDSFLSEGSYPYDIAESHQYFHLSTPSHGGHVGFTSFKDSFYYSEFMVLDFFKSTDGTMPKSINLQ